MKGKKVLALLTCTALLAGSLTACGNAASTTAPSAQEPQETSTAPASEAAEETPAASNENAADDSITGSLTIWEHGTGFENSLAAVIEGFQKKYPNVEVEYEIKDGDTYYSLLTTAIQSGEAPDLFWTNGTATTNMQDYVKNDVLMDISDLDFSALTEDSMKLATINDTVYSVPWLTMDTRACFYNKDLFTENGWEIPSKFSEFEDLLAKQKEAGVIPISFSPTSFGSVLFIFEPVLSAMDPEYTKGLSDYSVKLTDQPAKDALNKMLEWADKGYYGDNYKGVIDGSAAILTFTTGKAAMFIGGSWEMSRFPRKMVLPVWLVPVQTAFPFIKIPKARKRQRPSPSTAHPWKHRPHGFRYREPYQEARKSSLRIPLPTRFPTVITYIQAGSPSFPNIPWKAEPEMQLPKNTSPSFS